MKQNFQKNKVVTCKTAIFVVTILFVLTSASDMAVLYGNDAFTILVRSTKKCYSNFLKKSILFLENLFQS